MDQPTRRPPVRKHRGPSVSQQMRALRRENRRLRGELERLVKTWQIVGEEAGILPPAGKKSAAVVPARPALTLISSAR